MVMLLGITSVSAQILRTEELENYAKEKYGASWVDAATNLGSEITLDKNNALSYSQVIEAEGKTKEELYVMLNYWFTATFNDANSVIKLNDKDVGCIIAEGFVSHIADHAGGMNAYVINLRPIIRCDIKEGKIRVTYTVPYYEVSVSQGGGFMGAMAGTKATQAQDKWLLDECFPFADKDKHKKTSCKALVMANAYSNVIMDKIEECIKSGMVGNEGDDW